MRKGRDRNRVRAPRTASRDTRTEYPLPFSSRMWSGGQENTCVGPRQPDTVRPSALDAKGFDGAERARPDQQLGVAAPIRAISAVRKGASITGTINAPIARAVA